jgi:hypothetical protein
VNTPLRIQITDNAQAQISTAAAWSAKNRPAAPDAIRDELDRILDLLPVQPAVGTIARRVTLSGVRRVTISRRNDSCRMSPQVRRRNRVLGVVLVARGSGCPGVAAG